MICHIITDILFILLIKRNDYIKPSFIFPDFFDDSFSGFDTIPGTKATGHSHSWFDNIAVSNTFSLDNLNLVTSLL